jgi:hypothetical protein
MTFDPDIHDDFLLVDGLETVTLISGAATLVVPGAKRSQLETMRAQFGTSIVEVGDIVWLLPQVNLENVEPHVGDTITDGSEISWTIADVTYSPLTQVWRAVSTKQR